MFPPTTSTDIQCHSATATTSASDLILPRHRYKIVKGSPEFEQWKLEHNIHADVHYCQPTRHPDTSPETTAADSPVTNSTSVNAAIPGEAPFSVPDLPTSEGESLLSPESFTSEGAPLHMPLHVFTATPPTPSACDTLTQSAMLRSPDKAHFIAAQNSEIQGLVDSGVFSIHPIAQLPPRARLLNAIWSYKRKRLPTGAFHKYKSRLCSDGSQQ